jgi:type VI secretion system secreted protein VgrG
LGSITEITNQAGTPVQRYTYSSFGAIESQLDPNFIQPYGFTSREFDSETGLYFYRTRYYDAITGRFLQEDPVTFAGGINFYTLTLNNPVKYRDPRGLYAAIDDAIFAGGGAMIGIGGQALGDLVAGKLSGWQDYTAAGLGGAAGGEALLYTGPVGAGLVGGATFNLTKQALNNLSNKQCGFNTVSFLFDTAVGGLTGLIPGVRIPGITAGRNSFNAIYRQMVSKFTEGQISNLSAATAAKMAMGRIVDTGLIPGTGVAAAAGVAASGLISSGGTDCTCQ